ncbi:MFS transporter [Amycolatopsis jiangsuensis]|uniref:MHS family proline/betaine transporter-like MFS transporter n=1 Tax=Amycolatopsis jiangsuensis TaxID=1181879 RepID=A0A840J527_9PSEU|nr:MFS transporter [Amycolatopsis jiangsuensis]MBB4688725.1 MHS family proline/betaine transporter-like MFS transporter [Amycolatopsis jiangsuensis]
MNQSAPPPTVAATTAKTSRRAVMLASSIGNFVEWFDFTLYGYAAAAIAATFFPSGDHIAGLIGAFAVYGVAFVARPLGAVVFGRIGDRRGRRTALGTSVVLMGAATAAIGLIPGWAQIGVAAPILLLFCRLVQGFSAGGEYTGAMAFSIEHAPDDRRAWYSALVGASTWLGTIGATGVMLAFQAITGDGFTGGGWRWPFLIGGLLAVVGLVLRMRVDETPAFKAMQANAPAQQPARPFRELLRGHWRTLLTLFAYFAVLGLFTHSFLGYMPTYLAQAGGFSASAVLWLVTIANVVSVPAGFALAVLADRHGRRIQLRLGAVAAIVLVIPAYLLVGTGNLVAVVAALLILLLAVTLLSTGAISVLELYPTNVRFSGTALPYNVAYAIFGGTAPLVSQLLVDGTGSLVAPAIYASVVALIALPLLLRIPETRGTSLLR